MMLNTSAGATRVRLGWSCLGHTPRSLCHRPESARWIPREVSATLAVLLLFLLGSSASAQTLTGTVVEAGSESAVPGALVRLLGPDSVVQATAIADSVGQFAISTDGLSNFHVRVERFGYQPLVTPRLSATNPEGVYAVELELQVDAVAMEGIVVSADREAHVLARLHQLVGRNPRSLSRQPLLRDAIYSHVERGHSVSDMIRWAPGAHLVVQNRDDGPCFQLRGLYCLSVYLDGDHLLPDMIELVPLDLLETVLILTPNESAQYPGGAILLFTRPWLR